jgi:hypothetical protein
MYQKAGFWRLFFFGWQRGHSRAIAGVVVHFYFAVMSIKASHKKYIYVFV